MNYDFLEQEIHDRFGYGNIEVFKPSADKCNFDIVQMEWGFIPLLCQKQETCKDARLGYKDASGKCHHTYIILNAKGGEGAAIGRKYHFVLETARDIKYTR